MSDHQPAQTEASADHPRDRRRRPTKKKRKRRNARFLAAIGSVGLLVGATVIADLNNWFQSSLSHAATVAPQIEIDYITYSPPEDPSDPLQIDIELRNPGKQLAIVTALQLRVQQTLQLPLCLGQGNLPITGQSQLNLTPRTRVGAVITVPVHQTVSPDGADRFVVDAFGPESTNETDYLYRVQLELLYDRSPGSTVNIGELLLAFPTVPNNQYYWTTSDAANHGARLAFMEPEVPTITRCMIKNSRKLESLLTLTGIRPGLGRIDSQLSSSP